MRSSFVWLGLAVSTVSAGWILPESGAERQAAQKPYHHYSDASPSHTTSTISAYDISAAAQTSYIPSNRYDLADRPHSALGSMLHNLRVWLKEHSLAAPSLFSPSFHSPHALSAVTPTTTGDLHKLLLDPPADYTVSVDWSGPIFADMEGLATHTLSDGEIMARVRPMLLDATSSDGHLPGLKSGVVRVVIIRPDLIENLFYTAGHGRPEGSGLGPARNIFRVGPGMTGDAMGRRVDGQITEMLVSEERFRDIRAEAIANAAEQTKRVYANPADMPDDRRLVELNFREVWFADDDLAHPLSLPQMAEKVKFIIGDGRSQSQYLPTMKSGFIRAVYASRGMTETREFLPGYWREGGAGEHAPEYEEKKVYSEEDYERMRKGTYRPPTMDVKPYRPKVRTEGLENGS